MHPRPALGYAMVAAAATLFAVNAPVVKVIEHTGIDAQRLTEVRSTGAFVGLALIVLATRRAAVRTGRRELVLLVTLGIGIALVQWSYFFAIHRLHIGEVLLIQYVAPLLVALVVRFVFHERVRARIWAALALCMAGLVLVVRVWQTGSLDGVGIAVAGVACLSYAFYLLLAERGIRRREAVSLLAWGFLFSTLFWSAVEPWWSFPAARFAGDTSLLGRLSSWHAPLWLLVTWVIVLGTIVPFVLVVGALQHIDAPRVAIVAMLEPAVAIVVAWAWLGESLHAVQVVGTGLTLAGIALAQTAR